MTIHPIRSTVLAIGLSATLAAQAPVEEKPRETGLVASLLEKAKACIGTPYRYGGTTLRGFDCSGFVRFVFGTVGIDLDRTSAAQASQGDSVDPAQIQPGDLLFFHTTARRDRISHVGIYLGGGQFIHAGSWGGPGRRGVKIARLESGYFSDRLVSARRLLTSPAEMPKLLGPLLMQEGAAGADRD